LASLNEHEALTPTTIGHGVAVPHVRLGGANNHVVVVFARLKQELQYDLNQNEKVKLVFMVSTGSNEKQYLNVLRMIASNISDKKIYERLLHAEDKSEVHHVFSEIRMNQPLTS
jgi:PTS system nitrogen regulatory IIA component